jgi:hypothetical protein
MISNSASTELATASSNIKSKEGKDGIYGVNLPKMVEKRGLESEGGLKR